MISHFYDTESEAEVAILTTSLKINPIKETYLDPFSLGSGFMAIQLDTEPRKKKSSVTFMKEFWNDVKNSLPSSVKYLIVTDAEYFKVISGSNKAEANLGYVLDCKDSLFKVVYAPSYVTIFSDPEKVKYKISRSIEALLAHKLGTYSKPGSNIIKFAAYPETLNEITDWLDRLTAMDCDLTCDIEAYSLKHYDSGIGSIAFAWDKHAGISFLVDDFPSGTKNEEVRAQLFSFFTKFEKKIIYHNISFDGTVLAYQLFMSDLIDQVGLHLGLETILKNWDDTKLIAYLATNSCAGNDLSLKSLAQEFAGNYALEEIKDIRLISKEKLLSYNLVDALSTWYVYDKYYPIMVADQQEDVYTTLFKPATLDIVQMQLSGVPINMNTVLEVKKTLQKESDDAIQQLLSSSLVQEFQYKLNEDWVNWKNSVLKKKRVTISDAKEIFNPNSPQQLQQFLYEFLNLPIIEYTESKQPATGGDVIKNLKNHTKDKNVTEILQALLDFKAVDKILTTFIPAFEQAPKAKDGWNYLFGSFNLGGTVSGRLSSNKPNLQQLPANSKYGKLIKTCFEAPPGYLYVGLDFSSLEDRISALTTKDPNKLKVYIDGYDGHCLRAHAYFSEQMPDIEPAKETDRCFSIQVGGQTKLVKSGTLVTCPDGQVKLIEDYYDSLERNKRLP